MGKYTRVADYVLIKDNKSLIAFIHRSYHKYHAGIYLSTEEELLTI